MAHSHPHSHPIHTPIHTPFTPPFAPHSHTHSQVNVIELVSSRPKPALDVVGGFDMLQCAVAVRPALPGDRPGGPLRFVYTEETLKCVSRREIRFTRYVLGPLRQTERGRAGSNTPLSRAETLTRMVRGLLVHNLNAAINNLHSSCEGRVHK